MIEEADRPSGRSRGRARFSASAAWLLAATIFGSALSLGSIHLPVLLVVTGALAVAVWLAWFNAEPSRPRSAANTLFAVGVLLTLYTALQCVPLPAGFLARIAPENADTWARALSPFREPGPTWAPISLDPNATRVEVLRGVAYLLTFLVTIRVARRREGIEICSMAIVVTAMVLGVAALLHPAFHAEKVFGLYRPETLTDSNHVAPILNANVLAGYVNLGLLIAFASALTPSGKIPRVFYFAFAVVLAGIEVWVGSRGGVLTMVLGVGLVLWMMRLHGNSSRVHSSYAVYGVIGLTTVAMGVLSTSDPAWRELADPDTSKLGMAVHVVEMLKHSMLLGVGRGAFESVFPVFREGTGYLVFTHPENAILQWSTEWGLAVSVAAFAAIAWALRPSTVFSRNRSAIGPFCAILCIAVHNLVDFSSEFPGVVIAVTVCAGIVVGGTSGSTTTSRFESWGSRPRALAWGSVAIAGASAAFAASALGRDLYSDRDRLRDLALLPTTTRAAFHAEIRAAMLRHPAEPYLPFTGALRATRTHDESVIPWAARTLERSPVHGPAHLLLARGFFRGSPAQARLEYRYAMAQAPERVLEIRREVAPLVTSFDDAMELVAPGPAGDHVLTSLAADIGNRLPATRERLDQELIGRRPDDVDVLTRRSEESLRDLAALESWCTGDSGRACADAGLVRARRLQEAAPQKCAGFSAEAMLVAKTGDPEQAFQTFSVALERIEDRSACLVQLVEVAKLTGSELRTTNAIDSLARAGCATEEACVDNLVQAATFEEQRGNSRRALAFTRKALERAPERDDVAASAARNASRLGLHAEALDGYARLSRRHPEDVSWSALADSERQALVR